ncbi:hypothetical protein IM40_03710 [Candidatus Paracaedimonas acanthamoebae]|nr:hypothetical protein IM40_03710 [Candidatus Paracaedimonas acanthamoebae]
MLVSLARQEGMLALKGNTSKAGPTIEKYLSVFKEALSARDPKYKNYEIGYDWCCAYVYYLMKQAGYELDFMPVKSSIWHLAAVRTWYNWAIQEDIFIESSCPSEAGDLVLFDKLIKDKELDHIGILLEIHQNYIITSEGNYHNCAGIFKRQKDSTVRGFIRL